MGEFDAYSAVAVAGCPASWLNYEHGFSHPQHGYSLDHWRTSWFWPGGWKLYFNAVEEINSSHVGPINRPEPYAHITLGVGVQLEDDSWEMGDMRLSQPDRDDRWLRAFHCFKRLDTWLKAIKSPTAKAFPYDAILEFVNAALEQEAVVAAQDGLYMRHGIEVTDHHTKWTHIPIGISTESASTLLR